MRIGRRDLVARVGESVHEAGWAALIPAKTERQPQDVYFTQKSETIPALLYIWNITHGGQNRPADEYRIQVTGVDHFEEREGWRTLILGYWPLHDVFAGWDVLHHRTFRAGSPSLQIREEYLLSALPDGFAICPKGQGELAIAFAPSFLVEYVRQVEALHSAGETATDLQALDAIARSEGPAMVQEIGQAAQGRQVVLTEVWHRKRESSFRSRVLTAYDHRCAICGVQLDLVDAAHIVPVSHPESTDETWNGMCLCTLHHRAYDVGLLGVLPTFEVRVRPDAMVGLERRQRSGGSGAFRRNLRRQIVLPSEVELRPRADALQLGLELRGWRE